MQNLNIYLPLVNGGELPLDFLNGRDLIHEMVTDDFGAPPLFLCIDAKTDDGKTVSISIPYNDSDKAVVKIID